jgi:hypothetical protein
VPTESREKAWYPFAEAVLAELNYETAIVGDQRSGGGEWGTPDVLGYYLVESTSGLIPIRRIAAVEVKFALTRAALAQANAYRRFAHYVFLAVAQCIADLPLDLRAECHAAGIGLMCRKQTNSPGLHLFSEPVFNPCDEEEVEELLRRSRDGANEVLADVIGRETRKMMFRALSLA